MKRSTTPTGASRILNKRDAYVTIQEVEATHPCSHGYRDALLALKCLPDPKGDFTYLKFPYKKSAYSPTARVPLEVVGAASTAFLSYVLARVLRLSDLITTKQTALDEVSEDLRGEIQDQISELENQIYAIETQDVEDLAILQFPEKKRRARK